MGYWSWRRSFVKKTFCYEDVTSETKKLTVTKTLCCLPNNMAHARAHSREARDLKLRV